MRSLLVAAAATLMVAGTALGASATISIEVPGHGNSYEPADGEAFWVEIRITSDVNMSAWGMDLACTPGYKLIGYGTENDYGQTSNYADSNTAPSGEAWGTPYNSAGWELEGALQWDPQNPWTTPIPIGTIYAVEDVGAVSGFAMTFRIKDLSLGVGGKIDMATAASVGDMNLVALDDLTVVPLILIPEPAAALFLLGGLPLVLRRRR